MRATAADNVACQRDFHITVTSQRCVHAANNQIGDLQVPYVARFGAKLAGDRA